MLLRRRLVASRPLSTLEAPWHWWGMDRYMICVLGWRLQVSPIVILSLAFLFHAPATTSLFQCPSLSMSLHVFSCNNDNTKTDNQSTPTSQPPTSPASRTHVPSPPQLLKVHISHLALEPFLRRPPTAAPGPSQSPHAAPAPRTARCHYPHLPSGCCQAARPGPPGLRRMPRPAPPKSYAERRRPPARTQAGQHAPRSSAKCASVL